MRAAGSAVLMAMLLFGCGSSIRMVHQSNVYFERCHTADFDPSVSVDRKQQCWAQWLEHYTEGQSPDRVRYARQRYQALQRGEVIAPLPGLPSGAGDHGAALASARRDTEDRAVRESVTADAAADAQAEDAGDAEVDTEPGDGDGAAEGANAGADAGATAEGQDREDDAAPSSEPERASPPPHEIIIPSPPSNAETACTPVCNPRWDTCVRDCVRHRMPDGCEDACESEYRTCMRGCF